MSTIKNEITKELVVEAYMLGLSIVTMYRYYGIMSDKLGVTNQLVHNRVPIEPGLFSGGLNRDGLYAFGWFHLDDEPIVVFLPDIGDRYFI